jgi:hypothetical protein
VNKGRLIAIMVRLPLNGSVKLIGIYSFGPESNLRIKLLWSVYHFCTAFTVNSRRYDPSGISGTFSAGVKVLDLQVLQALFIPRDPDRRGRSGFNP